MKYIINDTDMPFSFPDIVVLNTNELTEQLYKWEGWKQLPRNTTRLVFPGNGALDVYAHLGDNWLNEWHVDKISATRFWWPGVNPGAVVGELPPVGAFDFQTTDVVIIDDVISSGITVKRVRDRNRVWVTRARWHALAWVKQKSCRLRGFKTIFSGIEVGKDRRVPINSLGTLLSDAKIAESYARRNIDDYKAFLSLLQELR